MTTIIETRALTKRYRGHIAVNGVDLDVREGEIFGILGPNGAGKTTTLEMIEGLRTPDAGSITVDGIDAIAHSTRVRKIIGVQLQTTALFPYLSATELIALFAAMYEMPDTGDRAGELLALVGLEDKASARVEELSGGQQQRLSIALALVNQPRVTFLDEPTTGLDPHARRNLWETVLSVREAGTTVVLTTHYMEEAEVLCDRVAIMDGGRVIACDTPTTLIRALELDATVSATVENGAVSRLDDATLSTLPGVARVDVVPEGDVTRVSLGSSDAQETIVGLLRLAGERGIALRDLGSSRATLEDVFLARTGRTYEDSEVDAQQDDPTRTTGRRRGMR